MIDPITRNEELQNLTENIFRNIFNKLNSRPSATLPSHQSAENAKRYQQTYGTNYIIKNGPKNKYYTASDLIKLYINQQIHNNTELKVFNSKKPYFRFISLMKREPFASVLKDYYRDNNDSPDPNTSYTIAKLLRNSAGKLQYVTEKRTLPEIAQMINSEPGLENTLQIYDSAKSAYVPVQSSEMWAQINNIKNNLSLIP